MIHMRYHHLVSSPPSAEIHIILINGDHSFKDVSNRIEYKNKELEMEFGQSQPKIENKKREIALWQQSVPCSRDCDIFDLDSTYGSNMSLSSISTGKPSPDIPDELDFFGAGGSVEDVLKT